MNFLEKNGFKAALAIAVAFFILPFVFPEKGSNYQQQAAAQEASGAKKGFVKNIYDRIGKFYGFKKHKKTDTVVDVLASLKNEAETKLAAAKAAEQTRAAYEGEDGEGDSAEVSSIGGIASLRKGPSASAKGSSKMGFKAPLGAQETTLSINGKKYKVLSDPFGKDYAITENGPVAAATLVAKGGVINYPSGKRASSASVSYDTQENEGGGVNVYTGAGSSNTFKGGKGGKGGKVNSTSKISSGLSLSGGGGGGGKGGKKGGGASPRGFADIDQVYSDVSNKLANVPAQGTQGSQGSQGQYYDVGGGYSGSEVNTDVSSILNAKAAGAYTPKTLDQNLYGPSSFGNGSTAVESLTAKPIAADSVGNKTPAAPSVALTAPTTLSLGSTTDTNTPKPEAKEQTLEVVVNPGKNGIIPSNQALRKDMITALFGNNVKIKNDRIGVPSGVKGATAGAQFYDLNGEIFNVARCGSGTENVCVKKTWIDSDAKFKDFKNDMNTAIKNNKNQEPYAEVIVYDGGNPVQSGQDNYFGNIAKDMINNSKQSPVKLVIFGSDQAKDVYIKEEAVTKAGAGDYTVIKTKHDVQQVVVSYNPKGFVITPNNNVDFFRKISNAGVRIASMQSETKNLANSKDFDSNVGGKKS